MARRAVPGGVVFPRRPGDLRPAPPSGPPQSSRGLLALLGAVPLVRHRNAHLAPDRLDVFPPLPRRDDPFVRLPMERTLPGSPLAYRSRASARAALLPARLLS